MQFSLTGHSYLKKETKVESLQDKNMNFYMLQYKGEKAKVMLRQCAPPSKLIKKED